VQRNEAKNSPARSNASVRFHIYIAMERKFIGSWPRKACESSAKVEVDQKSVRYPSNARILISHSHFFQSSRQHIGLTPRIPEVNVMHILRSKKDPRFVCLWSGSLLKGSLGSIAPSLRGIFAEMYGVCEVASPLCPSLK